MKTLLHTRIFPTNLRLLAVAAAATLAAVAVLPVPVRGAQTKSFCESGSAVALQFGAGGAVWSQDWGLPAWSWFQCDASPDIGFLDQNVVGMQVTSTSGSPAIDADLVLRLPFQGTITLTAYEEEDATQIAGEILGRMSGSFVADLNAARAVIGDQTITIRFGQSVHSAPDALIQVTSTTGRFQSLQAVGDWEWHVRGTVTIARVPTLAPQLNILAALQNPALLLGAEEEVVLSGSYQRSQPVH